MITIEHCGLCDIDSGGNWHATGANPRDSSVADFSDRLDKVIEKWSGSQARHACHWLRIVREHFAPVFSKGKIVEGSRSTSTS